MNRSKALLEISQLNKQKVKTVRQFLSFNTKVVAVQKKYQRAFDNFCKVELLSSLTCCDEHRALKELFDKRLLLCEFFNQSYDVQVGQRVSLGSDDWLAALKKAANL